MAASMGSTMVPSTADPAALLNTQLASALSTLGDAQFWEETISPSTIRSELSSCDPSNPNSTPTLLKGMKWLLASISKGRDVSDFYPHVVKMVGATSLEVRKMVYMYLVQYADYDATTRELSLLSINSFQRGLADHEQLIRALALRVLSSIRIPDILQIQILGVQKCATDRSPYVRKCAANALAKLAPRCDPSQQELLLEVMINLLNSDTSTMVLSSALIAFCELCPERLELLHVSFRKICHLLTDMDEWGQVAILELLSRYCRKFFQEPKGWKGGSAEQIDRQRRVRRTLQGIVQESTPSYVTTSNTATNLPALQPLPGTNATPGGYSDNVNGPPNNRSIVFSDTAPKKIRRRVVVEGFYSDEEDHSAEEEVYASDPRGPAISTATAMRQRNIMGLPTPGGNNTNNNNPTSNIQMGSVFGTTTTSTQMGDEDWGLDEDHKLLLQSAMPLLKSRNAGVVLGVCSLLYYCGVSSVSSRSALGKALVRIHRGRREIQYVVLNSIRSLVHECPSAFAPFLNDFFVKALDAPHTRIIKIDILVSLSLEPAAIEAVLTELRTYIRSGDKKFVCAAIRGVGRVAELARIVYDRHGQTSEGGNMIQERQTANKIALDCLYGLAVVTETCKSPIVVGAAMSVMQTILTMLWSDRMLMSVEDPNEIQNFAIRRLMLLLLRTLSLRVEHENKNGDKSGEDSDEEEPKQPSDLETFATEVPPEAVASALWIIGEWMSFGPNEVSITRKIDGTTKSKYRLELLRILDQVYPQLVPTEKDQAIHYSAKVMLSDATSNTTGMASSDGESALCEHILSMGRIDVNPNVKDQARMISAIVHMSIGLKHDLDNLETAPTITKKLSTEDARNLLLERKPAPSFLPIEEERTDSNKNAMFRFGTLSSLVGHQARGTYLPLPPWAEKNSPKALRDPIEVVKDQVSGVPSSAGQISAGGMGFYGDDSSSDDSSSDDSSSSSESSDGQNADSESESESESDDSTSSSDDVPAANGNLLIPPSQPMSNGHNMMGAGLSGGGSLIPTGQPAVAQKMQTSMITTASSSDSSEDDSSSSSSSSSSSDSYGGDISSANLLSPNDGNLLSMGSHPVPQPSNAFFPSTSSQGNNVSSSTMDDLKGLVMAPIAVDQSSAADPNSERDSSAWIQLVRPELCGGLAVTARYLRGPTKIREAQLQGLDPALPNLVCVQVQFSNKKSDGKALRRIRIMPRSSPSGSIPVKKALCPPEVMELQKGQVSNATICILFASASNRQGDMVAKFDIKSSISGVPVELRPSLGDLLLPQKAPTVTEFDASLSRMQGFQRVTSSFQTKDMKAVPKLVMKNAAVTPVGGSGWINNKLRFCGGLPASNDTVWILLESDPSNGSGTLTVCCDHAMAVNSILNLLKHALAN